MPSLSREARRRQFCRISLVPRRGGRLVAHIKVEGAGFRPTADKIRLARSVTRGTRDHYMLGVVLFLLFAAILGDKFLGSAWAGVILLIIAVIALANWQARRNAQKPPVWRGRMYCITCRYEWTSRRQTPPARCPACGTGNIRHRLE